MGLMDPKYGYVLLGISLMHQRDALSPFCHIIAQIKLSLHSLGSTEVSKICETRTLWSFLENCDIDI